MAIIGAQLEGIIEGPITKSGTEDVQFTVMGVTVRVKKSAETRRRIRTTTLQKVLGIGDLLNETSLPGLAPAKGFVGCTAIVAGNFDTSATGAARALIVEYPPANASTMPVGLPWEKHPFLEVGPPESLLLGPCTSNSGGNITVNDIPVVLFQDLPGAAADSRFIADDPKNEFGIKIDMKKIQVDDPVSVEGFPIMDGGTRKFVALAVVVDSPAVNLLADTSKPQVGITRAQARVRRGFFELEVRGGIYTGPASAGFFAPQIIAVQQLDENGKSIPPNAPQASNNVGTTRADAAAGDFGKWELRVPLRLTGTIPSKFVGVLAQWINGPSNVEPDSDLHIEIRDDPDVPPTP